MNWSNQWDFPNKTLVTLIKEENVNKEETLPLKLELSIIKMKEFGDKYNLLKRRVDQQQDFSRRNKIRIEGVEETAEMTQEKVQHLLRDTLEIREVQLERTYRIGNPIRRAEQSRPRTTIAWVSHFAWWEQPLRNSPK